MRKKNWQSGKAGALKGPATLDQVRAEVSLSRDHPDGDWLTPFRLLKQNVKRTYNVKRTPDHAEEVAVVVVHQWGAEMHETSPEVDSSACRHLITRETLSV